MSNKSYHEKKLAKKVNKMKFFHKNIIEGKNMAQCAREIGVSSRTLRNYKADDDYREMAIKHLETSELNGLQGTVSKLVKALDSKRPIVLNNADGSTRITHVDDKATQMTALKEIVQIYGLHAPKKENVTAEISISSDEDIYREIESAQRSCGIIDARQEGRDSYAVDPQEQEDNRNDFKSRERAILQDAAIQEPE